MKSRNNTVGTNTTITTGDIIGSIQFGGFDGVDYASIMGKIDFQAGGSGMAENDTAGEMVFYTTADGSGGSGSSERMRIASTGKIGIGGTLGTAHLFVQDPLEGTSTQIATIKAKGSSYGTEAVNIFSERAADTAFSFMRMLSNDNADVEFNFRGDGQGLADGAGAPDRPRGAEEVRLRHTTSCGGARRRLRCRLLHP